MHTALAVAPAVPPGFKTITLAAAAVFLVLAGLLKWKPLRRVEFLIPWFCLVAGIGLSAAFLQRAVVSGGGMVRNAVPIFGGVVLVGAAIFFLFVVLYDLWPNHPTNGLTSVSAVLLPSFVPFIGGAVGSAATAGLSYLAIVGATAIAALFGVK